MENRYLFRGITVDNREWAYGSYSYGDKSNQHFISVEKWPGCHDFQRIVPETIGQCTGLTAAKSYRGDSELDRMVFEGDIGINKNYSDIFVVKWEMETHGFIAEYEDGARMFLPNGKDFKIIGTIYDKGGDVYVENPETNQTY